MGSNFLEDLPADTLDKVLCLLDPPALVHLHTATGAGKPAVAQRINIMRAVHHCAHHWLHLTDRVATPQQYRRRRRAHRRGQVQQDELLTKFELLEELRFQISHINDVAAFVYYWAPCRYLEWTFQAYCPIGEKAEHGIQHEHSKRMDKLNNKIHEALSLGYQGYLDFSNKKQDPRNKVKEFRAFDHGDIQYCLEFNDQLLFLCTLHRLQQLNPEAVLARLHSIFSKCSRFDLLLASRVFDDRNSATQDEYQASKQEVPAADILTAFAQHEPHIRPVVSKLTAVQREEMTSCVQTMVLMHLQADSKKKNKKRSRWGI
ncbi:TPA: hypothetical protein ACH3X2_012066 [Trebouxia sp. C0005]